MSSPSRPHRCDAVVRHSGQVTGPIRLPLVDAEMFMADFNRLYRLAGLSVASTVPPPDHRSSPASPFETPDATADRHR
jgi:hypothetical protein